MEASEHVQTLGDFFQYNETIFRSCSQESQMALFGHRFCRGDLIVDRRSNARRTICVSCARIVFLASTRDSQTLPIYTAATLHHAHLRPRTAIGLCMVPLETNVVAGKDAEELTTVVTQEDGILFCMTSDADVTKIFSLNKKAPTLVLRKKENEKLSTFDGTFEREAISEFLSANELPLVVIFNHETTSAIFEDEAGRQIIFVLVDLADKEAATPVLNFFALTTEETKMIRFSIEENGRKFMYSGDFSVESIKVSARSIGIPAASDQQLGLLMDFFLKLCSAFTCRKIGNTRRLPLRQR
ncbi:unnamed protein product [Sphagnum balticum]